jgi:hypothetical protein
MNIRRTPWDVLTSTNNLQEFCLPELPGRAVC